jgi:hypothetical protein
MPTLREEYGPSFAANVEATMGSVQCVEHGRARLDGSGIARGDSRLKVRGVAEAP